MNQVMLKAQLSAAERHVANGEHRIALQREIVAELERNGRDSVRATLVLRSFEQSQAFDIAHRERLRKELGL
jgi:hypothetical protein